jgi:MraZ protein
VVHFTGKYTHTFDAKGRVFVPKKFLHALTPIDTRCFFWANIGLDPCVTLYTPAKFDVIAAKLEQERQGEEDIRNFTQMFFETAYDLEIDSAGRILIPDELRQHAGLKVPGEVVLSGAGDQIMIWDPATHASRRSQVKPHYADYAKRTGL